MTNNKVNNYEQFIVVAEAEWKFDYGNYETGRQFLYICCTCGRQKPKCPTCGICCSNCQNYCSCGHRKCASCGRQTVFTPDPRITKHSLKTGLVEWNIAFNDQERKLEFTCQNVTDGAVQEVHMELVRYSRSDPDKSYEKCEAIRHIFSLSSANSLSHKLYSRDNVFTIRILKKRSMFRDFTSESTVVAGRWTSDLKLRVGGQVFHVNKQLLVMHSEYFDRMFNGPYVEANQEEVELKHASADPAIFHDFLLVIFVTEALPNLKNVAALFVLANMYEVDSVRIKCHNHLSICREMPVEERYMLALENGNKELQTSIRRNVANLEESDRIIAAVSKKAVAL